MRKILLVIMLCCCLCSCTSLMSDFTNTPIYDAQAYSVQYTSVPFSKSDKILILCESGNFMFQREFETTMVNYLRENGIEAFAYSSLEIESMPESIEYLYAIAMLNDCRYVLIASVSEVYTYEHGGGIAQITFDSNMSDYAVFELPLRVNGAINCDNNVFQTYTESIEPAAKCMAEAISNEYLKYVEREV